MAETVDVPISDLILDQDNARLGSEQPSQQDVYTEMSKQQGRGLVNLAEDIVKNGLDPLTNVGVVPTGDRRRRYRVVEGNRRVLALKALETPSIVSKGLSKADQQRLAKLSDRYMADPLNSIPCILFADGESLHWVTLRHTGENNGVGLVGWDTNEQDRFRARHSGSRKPAGQILDFVDKVGLLSEEAKQSKTGILTNVERLIISREARDTLGIDVVNGEVVSYYSAKEVAKGLTKVVDDFKCKRANVHDVYMATDRERFVKDVLASKYRPKGKRLAAPVNLSNLAKGVETPVKAKPRRRRTSPRQERTSVIPASCSLNIVAPRLSNIYNELNTLNAEAYPNACAVLLRVFLELSTDHGLEVDGVSTEAQRQGQKLAVRLKSLANYYFKKGKVSDQIRKAVIVIGERSAGPIYASTFTMNQYVHNPHVHPTSAELRAAWDQLQPFVEAIWP
jgi:hypothetical protein